MKAAPGWLKRLAPPVLTVAALLVAWSVYVARAGVSPFVLPAPEAIAGAFVALIAERDFARHLGTTLLETLSGFVIATITDRKSVV